MCEEQGDGAGSTNRPDRNSKIQWLGFVVGVDFVPPLALDRKDGHKFAITIADYIAIDHTDFTEGKWVLKSRMSAGNIVITITATALQFQLTEPSVRQEWLDEKYQLVLSRFIETFSPQVILGSKALARGLLDIDGDARTFIGGHLMNMNPKSLAPLARPLHGLGLRLFLPPYNVETESGDSKQHEDWSLNVKIESWLADPSKLFLEAEGNWQEPKDMTEDTASDAVSRLASVSTFMQDNLLRYLVQDEDENEGENDD